MQLYWLRQSVPELADLPKELRRRLFGKTLWRTPWVLALDILIYICFYFASFVPALLISRDMIGIQDATRTQLILAIFAVGGISGLIANIPSWIIGAPIVIHFLRPRLRMFRDADEQKGRSTP